VCLSLFQFLDIVRRVLADVVLLIVHTYDTPVDGEQRPLEADSDCTVEVLALVLRHLEDNLGRIGN